MAGLTHSPSVSTAQAWPALVGHEAKEHGSAQLQAGGFHVRMVATHRGAGRWKSVRASGSRVAVLLSHVSLRGGGVKGVKGV